MGNTCYEVTVMSDEEFTQYHKEQRKQNFLKELKQLSRPTTKGKSFSIKDVPKDAEPVKEESTGSNDLHIIDRTSEEDWGGFVDSLKEHTFSPIDDITDDTIADFQVNLRSKNKDDFDTVFKDETAMMAELLKDVKAIGKEVGKDISRLAKAHKGKSPGVNKSYSDLVDVYNGIIHNEFQLIKGIADFKTKQMDWYLKDKEKNRNVMNSDEDVDSVVNRYYGKVIDGGSMRNYNAAATSGYQAADFAYDEIEEPATPISDETMDTSGIDSVAMSTGFNISQPLRGSKIRDNYYDSINGDTHGHIATEYSNVEICVYKYGETMEFVALDENGEPVSGVELPSDTNPGIVAGLQVRPGSDYVYDKYGRKYRMFEKTHIDISDVDDMDYPFDSDEDK